MFKHLSPWMTLLFAGSLAAATDDYAFQARLSQTDDALQRVVLPAEVLESLAQRNLSDLVVFNADGKNMPQLVFKTRAEASDLRIDLPFHEFDRYLKQRSKTVTTREQNQQDGQLSELATTEVLDVESVRKDYLIELRPDGERRKYERVELEWRHEPASQVLKVRAEAGDDLDSLHTIASSKTLTNRESEDIKWRSLRGVGERHSYLRLTALSDIDSFELLGAIGHYREYGPQPKTTVEVTPEVVDEDGTRYYRLRLPSAIFPESMRIVPATPNSILRGDLYLQMRNNNYRSPVKKGFRQHNLGGAEVKASEPLSLPQYIYTEVWFEFYDEIAAVPRVELIYPQRELVFLGDGNGPYRLAWGNHEVTTSPPSLRGLVEISQDNGDPAASEVTLFAIEEAGGAARLAPAPTLPWKKWLLWAVLIAAALIAARMAFNLYREMNAPAQ